MSTATLSQSDLQGLSNLAAIGNHASAELAAIASHDQKSASERDKLVKRGYALVGAGLTIERVSWANDVIAYARNMGDNTQAGANRVIGELQRSILHMANDLTSDATGKTGKLRTFNDSLQLALVTKSMPQVKFMDWGVAVQFNRFLEKFNVINPEIVQLEAGKALASAIMLKKPEFLNKNGFLDKKLIRAAIDAILGKSRKTKGKTDSDASDDADDEAPTVTSLEAVAQWMQSATDEQLTALTKLLCKGDAKRAEHIVSTMVNATAE